MIWFDWIIIAILLAGLWHGLTRGFSVMLFELGATVAALLGAYALTPPALTFLDQHYGLVKAVSAKLVTILPFSPVFNLPVNILPLPDLVKLLSNSGLPPIISQSLQLTLGALPAGITTISQVVSYTIARLLLALIAWMLLFYLIRFILGLFAPVFGNLLGLFLPGALNKMAGAVLGLVLQVVYVTAFIGPFVTLSTSLPIPLSQFVKGSLLAPYFARLFDSFAPLLLRLLKITAF